MKKLTALVIMFSFWIGLFTTSVAALPTTPYNNFASFIPVCNSGQIASKTPVCSDVQKQNSSNGNVIINIIKDGINIISFIVGIAAVLIIIISGFRLIVSGGDANKVKEAKLGLAGAVIGIVIVALAQSFVIFVLDKIG